MIREQERSHTRARARVLYRWLRELFSTEKLQTTHESAASKQHSSSRIYEPLCLNIWARSSTATPKRSGFDFFGSLMLRQSVCVDFYSVFLKPVRVSRKHNRTKSDTSRRMFVVIP